MPPKVDPKAPVHTDPPKIHKKFADEEAYHLWATKKMESEDIQKLAILVGSDAKGGKAPPAKGKDDKGKEAEKVDPKDQQFNKDGCIKFIEAVIDTYLLEKDIEAIWEKIPRAKDKDGKTIEMCGRI